MGGQQEIKKATKQEILKTLTHTSFHDATNTQMFKNCGHNFGRNQIKTKQKKKQRQFNSTCYWMTEGDCEQTKHEQWRTSGSLIHKGIRDDASFWWQ